MAVTKTWVESTKKRIMAAQSSGALSGWQEQLLSPNTLLRHLGTISGDASRLRLQTIVRLRWLAVLGQIGTICFVWLVMRFPMPVGYCLAIVALSAWVNVAL